MPYKDKTKQREAQARYQRTKRLGCMEYVRDLKDNQPCVDCGVKFRYWILDFDHVNGDKVEGVAELMSRGARAAMLREIPKCELVCANCHRERTQSRKQHMKTMNG